ncbi:hypothetical protein [Andreprevotia lacus]|uniref:hypothetical protein n=1 Tax=Andreprevotia lacus TaxID=1121000 RepID=UPI00111C2E86|nr:hypothetical protein [Andreprevotia lacus]
MTSCTCWAAEYVCESLFFTSSPAQNPVQPIPVKPRECWIFKLHFKTRQYLCALLPAPFATQPAARLAPTVNRDRSRTPEKRQQADIKDTMMLS